MALDDYLDSEAAVVGAALATLASSRVRGLIRRGLVLGLAQVLSAGDAAALAIQTLTHAGQPDVQTAGQDLQDIWDRSRSVDDAAHQPRTQPPARTRRRRGQRAGKGE